MPLSFDASYYMKHRPDVLNAYVNGGSEAGTGLSWPAFAAQHYNTFGWKEGSNPNAIFNTSEYLAANLDVLAAGVNPFTHYLAFGATEGRAPSDSFIQPNNFDWQTYLDENPDLGVAGIDTAEEAYGHYVVFGQFEDRSGVPAPFNPGETVSLTTGIDNAKGTAGDDIVNGVIAGVGVGTFNTGDSIDGAGGNDTLKLISAAAGGGAITAASIKNVETIEVQALAANTINLSNATGVKNLASANGNSSTTFTSVQEMADISLTNTTGGTVTVGYAAGLVAGLADAQNVSVNNATGTVNVAGIETFNIEATGANALSLTNDGNTVNVSGSGSLALGGTLSVTTLNASANSGGVSATIGAGNVAVTGSSGNDTFTFGSGLTIDDTVNGGGGFDTVRVNGGNYTAATAAAAFNALASIERLAFDGNNGVTINGATFTNAGITNIQINTGGGGGGSLDTINNASSARTYEIGTANTGAATFNMSGGSTKVDLVLMGTAGLQPGTGDADVGALAVNLSGTEAAGTVATINIDSQGNHTGATFNNVGVITTTAGSAINISGAGNLDIAGLASRAVVNASEFTGNLVIEGSQAAGAAVANAALSGADVITLGQGLNRVEFNNALDSGVSNTTASAGAGAVFIDNIIGFTAGAGGDVLDWTPGNDVKTYTALAAATQTAIDALSGTGATLEAALNLAASTHNAAGWTAFSFQGQTYAVYENAADAGNFDYASDLAVQLTGVSVADLTAANFA